MDTETAPRYKLTLTGEGISLEKEVDQHIALAVVNTVLTGVPGPPAMVMRPNPPGGATVLPAPPAGGELSVGEHIAAVQAKRNPDKIAAIAVYMKDRGVGSFTRDDVKAQFQAAGEPTPANFSRDFAWALSSKWVAPAQGAPGEFYVTNTGIEAVKNQFSADIRKGTRQSTRRKTRKSPGKGEAE